MTSQEIKELRLKLNLTQEGLSKLLGISFQTINRWERDTFKPSPLAIQKLKKLAKSKKANT